MSLNYVLIFRGSLTCEEIQLQLESSPALLLGLFFNSLPAANFTVLQRIPFTTDSDSRRSRELKA